jgi:hypothetical protein
MDELEAKLRGSLTEALADQTPMPEHVTSQSDCHLIRGQQSCVRAQALRDSQEC